MDQRNSSFSIRNMPIVAHFYMELSSGLWKTTNCDVLVVQHKSQNLMGILAKLGLTLMQLKTNKSKQILNINERNLEQKCTKWYSRNTHAHAQDYVKAKIK